VKRICSCTFAVACHMAGLLVLEGATAPQHVCWAQGVAPRLFFNVLGFLRYLYVLQRAL